MGLLDTIAGFLYSFNKPKNKYVMSVFEGCRHRQYHVDADNDETTTTTTTMGLFVWYYCCMLSISYVGALYILVPQKVRKLHRDHPSQIQFRSLASLIVCAIAVGTYPYLFCEQSTADESNNKIDSTSSPPPFSIRRIMFQPTMILPVLVHTISLYVGPIVASLFRVHEVRKLMILRGQSPPGSYPVEIFRQLIQPDLHSFLTPETNGEFWRNVRNLIVAPVTEEIIFRGCMIPPLLACTQLSVIQVTFIAPLFFGFAHVHHAVTRLSNGEKLPNVILITMFQFVYTTLFGSYASYAFIRTGSVFAVSVSHAYCNWMGLPDLSFVQIRHPMYQYRIILLASFLVGVFTFKWLLKSDRLLPLPPVLKEMMTGAANVDE
jgi:prenyl protein peptidase